MRFSRQEYWSGLTFPSPGDLTNPGIQPSPSALLGRFLTAESPGKPKQVGSLQFSCSAVSDSLWPHRLQVNYSLKDGILISNSEFPPTPNLAAVDGGGAGSLAIWGCSVFIMLLPLLPPCTDDEPVKGTNWVNPKLNSVKNDRIWLGGYLTSWSPTLSPQTEKWVNFPPFLWKVADVWLHVVHPSFTWKPEKYPGRKFIKPLDSKIITS